MKDYTFYIAAAYLLTAIVLLGLTVQSLLAARKASKDSGSQEAEPENANE